MRRIVGAAFVFAVLLSTCSGGGSGDGVAVSGVEWVTLDDGPVVVTQTSRTETDVEVVEISLRLSLVDRENFQIALTLWDPETPPRDYLFVAIAGEAWQNRDGSWSDAGPENLGTTTIASLDDLVEFRDRSGLELLGDGPRIAGEATDRFRVLDPDHGDERAASLREADARIRESLDQGEAELSEGPSLIEESAAMRDGASGVWEFTVGRRTGRVYTVQFELDGANFHQTLVTEFRDHGEPVVVEPPPL